MKILLMSYAYAPSLGGIELFSSLMRQALEARGHAVRVVTNTVAAEADAGVLRRPEKHLLREAIAWADLCFVSGVSMNYQLPALRAGKPIVITHHGWQENDDGSVTALHRFKLFVCRYALNIAVNRALAADLPMPALAIYNPVHTEVDLGLEISERPRDVIFVGRLVSQKGVPVLLEALATLKRRGVAAAATIVGDGSDRQALEAQAAAAGLNHQIEFTGRLSLNEVQALLGQHKIMAVPSVYKEAFGFVTLEGLAAGCMTLVSNAGGLPEAVGSAGLTFPMRDSNALADRIESVLRDPSLAAPFRQAIPAHLDQMRLDRIVDRYIDAFERYYRHHVDGRMSGRRAARRVVEAMTRA